MIRIYHDHFLYIYFYVYICIRAFYTYCNIGGKDVSIKEQQNAQGYEFEGLYFFFSFSFQMKHFLIGKLCIRNMHLCVQMIGLCNYASFFCNLPQVFMENCHCKTSHLILYYKVTLKTICLHHHTVV